MIAPAWHLLLIVALLLAVSFGGFQSQHRLVQHGRVMLYALTLVWQYFMVAAVYVGVRRNKVSMRELIGGRWENVEDFLVDVAIAAGYWISAAVVLGILANAMQLQKNLKADEAIKTIQMIAPSNGLELILWLALSMTAGLCEEIVFRGYLQKQFTAVTRSTAAAVIAQALLFAGGHGYEGAQRMALIGVYGAMFGVLAAVRRSLRPGMMAHAWHDAVSGIFLGFASKFAR